MFWSGLDLYVVSCERVGLLCLRSRIVYLGKYKPNLCAFSLQVPLRSVISNLAVNLVGYFHNSISHTYDLSAGERSMQETYHQFNLQTSKSVVRLSSFDPRSTNHFQTHAQDIPRVTRINHPVIMQIRAGLITVAIPQHLILQLLHPLLHRCFVDRRAPRLRTVRFDRLHDSRQLIRPHNATAGARPSEQEARLEVAAAHGVVPCTVGGSEDDGDGGDFGGADG